MKRWLAALLAAASMALPSLAGAASYTLPGSLPPGCSGSAGSYSCPALSLGYNDTITVASPTPATLTINGSFNTSNAQINVNGNASDLTLTVNGTLTLGYQAHIKANITAGSVNDSGGGRVAITGNLATTGGNISLAYQSSVTGNVSTSGGGTITTGQAGSITGNLSAGTGSILISETSVIGGSVNSSGAVTVGQSASVAGNISTGAGAIYLNYQSLVQGDLSSTGAVTLAQGARVDGDISGGAGNVSVGYGATVAGSLTTSSGTISFSQSAKASSCVRSTGSATITLGYQSNVNSVCCGGNCSNSCVVNNSTYAMPPACAAATPTLVSGTRYSFESYDVPGSYIRHSSFLGYVHPVSASSDSLTRNDATFIARPGLSNSACWSFESVNYPGYYLRHNNFVMKLHAYSSAALYLADATFCLRSGLANASSISFETTNYPGYYIQRKPDNSLIIATTDGSAAVNGRSTFYPRPGWASVVDHYELSVPSTGVACLASTVTVTACADSSSPCTNPVTNFSSQTATLATTAGTLGSTTVTFGAGGTATTTLAYPAASPGSTATVTLSGESNTALSARRCCPDGVSCSAANSCATTFNTAGFVIAASAGGAVATVPTQTAGTSSGNWVLRAVKTNTTTKACEAALSGSTSVNWGVQCNDPTTCSAGNRMTVTGSNAVAVAGNANGSSTASTAVPMNFDANGNAPFSFNYTDVGRITLFASKAAGGSLLAPLNGSSNAFVVKPAGFVLSGIRCTSYVAGSCATSALASPGNNPGAASGSGSAFMPAGRPFSATVTAVDAGGNATPNYGRETAPEGVTLTAALVLPVGGNAPALSNPSAFGGFSGGAATGTTFAWPEVGIITLTPTVADGNYLGAGAITGTTSGNVGRFIPANFKLTLASPAVSHRVDQSCPAAPAFTYLEENFRLTFTLTAQNSAGTTTRNYTGDFAKLTLAVPAGFNLAGIAGGTAFRAGNRLTVTTSTGDWGAGAQAGTAAVTLTAKALRNAGNAPDGPFNADFGIAPVDADGVGMVSFDLDTASPTGADSTKVGTIPLRFGRLRLQNAIAPANRVLNLPLAAQYWDGATSTFRTNDLDSCTRVNAANLSFGNLRKTLSASEAAMSGSSATLSQGVGRITLAAPTGGRVGSLDVAIALDSTAVDTSCLKDPPTSWTPVKTATAGANLAALRGFWCGSGARDPSARATWGLYRGADGVVYQRENY